MIGTERALAGAALPPIPDDPGEHVRNDIGRVNEAWIAELRGRPHADLLADFRAVTAERLASLRAMSAEEFNAPSWTPAGNATYARFMRIRIFDCWMHEQDIRAAIGQPGNDGGEAAAQALDEVVLALGLHRRQARSRSRRQFAPDQAPQARRARSGCRGRRAGASR